MSHEIRTPMNGIIGMLTLAENKLEANSPAMQYLTKADELSDHLIALINDILDMSRIEVGKVELEQGVFSLRALGNRLYDMFAKNLDSRGIRYEVNFEGVTVDYVCGDELRISQVIINFLSNAVKFTSEGEIIVTFRQMMLQNGVADWCSMRQRLDLVCLVYWCCLQRFCFACWSFCGWLFCGAKGNAVKDSRRGNAFFTKRISCSGCLRSGVWMRLWAGKRRKPTAP